MCVHACVACYDLDWWYHHIDIVLCIRLVGAGADSLNWYDTESRAAKIHFTVRHAITSSALIGWFTPDFTSGIYYTQPTLLSPVWPIIWIDFELIFNLVSVLESKPSEFTNIKTSLSNLLHKKTTSLVVFVVSVNDKSKNNKSLNPCNSFNKTVNYNLKCVITYIENVFEIISSEKRISLVRGNVT